MELYQNRHSGTAFPVLAIILLIVRCTRSTTLLPCGRYAPPAAVPRATPQATARPLLRNTMPLSDSSCASGPKIANTSSSCNRTSLAVSPCSLRQTENPEPQSTIDSQGAPLTCVMSAANLLHVSTTCTCPRLQRFVTAGSIRAHWSHRDTTLPIIRFVTESPNFA